MSTSRSYSGNIRGTFYDATGWSEADNARLFDLVAEGLSAAAIGRSMGRTKCSIIGRIRRRGLKLAREPYGGVQRLSKGKPARPRDRKRPVPLPSPSPAPASQGAPDPTTVVNPGQEQLPPAEPFPGRPAALSRPAPGPARTCQFPVNKSRPWQFCEQPTVGNSSWCERHRAIVWVRPPRWTT